MNTIKRDRMVQLTDTGTGQGSAALPRKPVGSVLQQTVKAPKTAVESLKKTVKKAAEQTIAKKIKTKAKKTVKSLPKGTDAVKKATEALKKTVKKKTKQTGEQGTKVIKTKTEEPFFKKLQPRTEEKKKERPVGQTEPQEPFFKKLQTKAKEKAKELPTEPQEPFFKKLQTKAKEKAKELSEEKPKGGTGGGGGGSGGGGSGGGGGGTGAPAAEVPETEPTFASLFEEMLARYMPEVVEFSPVDEDTLRETIAQWLRPAYEQAIRSRREQTDRYNAELDADAWARGMGESTYVTDVKDRAFQNEARDVDDLESNYASTLAGHLFDALKSQQEQKLEVDRFNAEQMSRAREHASDAALALYRTYLDAMEKEAEEAPTGGGGGGSGSGKAAVKKIKKRVTKAAEEFLEEARKRTGSQTAELGRAATLVARMTPQQRKDLYAGRGATAAAQRKELLKSLGAEGFASLMQQYPAE